jgi:hypothetical protein
LRAVDAHFSFSPATGRHWYRGIGAARPVMARDAEPPAPQANADSLPARTLVNPPDLPLTSDRHLLNSLHAPERVHQGDRKLIRSELGLKAPTSVDEFLGEV